MKSKVADFSIKNLPDGFSCKNKVRVFEKLQSFHTSGKDRLHLVLDFDRTLTLSQNSFGENVTTWEILANHLSTKSQSEYHKFYKMYRPLELAGKLGAGGAITWWESVLDLFKSEQLSWSKIEGIVQKELPARSQ